MAERRKPESIPEFRSVEEMRKYYLAVLNEPIPERLQRLVELIREKEKAR